MNTNRLYFIDAVRAFAILMMLQGHFIDTLLDASYRDTNTPFLKCWEYFRGITAPTFFTISGLIFSYLLIRAKHKGLVKKRMSKGIYRGLMLIGIGYVLRIPFFEWLLGRFNTYFLVVDVLQCIGISLIAIVIIYKLTFKRTLIFSILMFVIGVVIFTTEPYYRNIDTGKLSLILANYITKVNGSVFTILPWFGYMAFGSFISTIFYRYLNRKLFKTSIISGFLIIGLFLVYFSAYMLMRLYDITGIEVLKAVANYNYLYLRLGNVFILFALFYTFERFIKQPIILKIGQKTLSIYIIHFIIIYGSFTGYGLNQIIGKTLMPWQAIIGAFLFLISVCFISFHYVKTNAFIYSKIRHILDKVKAIKFTS